MINTMDESRTEGDALSITFVRGARTVTGANFLLEATRQGSTTRILVDCGLSQGEKYCESVNRDEFSYAPEDIDAVFFTHAHADHIGLFPKLVKHGFRGVAYATEPTRALMPVMLQDSVKLIADEALACGYEAPYEKDDVSSAVQKIESVPYDTPVSVGPNVRVTLMNAGHIMGSALVLIEVFGKRLLFTGDLGRVPSILVPDRAIPDPVDYLITESVYGNRVHGSIEESEESLIQAVRDINRTKGALLIPSFSLERTQIILSVLDRALSAARIPPTPVFLDSPLASKVTEIYRTRGEFLRDSLREQIARGDDPFSFPSLSITRGEIDSEAIDRVAGPRIIIAGAGMSHGGRIRRHERTYLPRASTILLSVGYQVPGSLGRRIADGAKKVLIDGAWVPVKARVRLARGFSAHADQRDLTSFAEAVKPKKIFVVLGDTESATFLAQRLSGFLGVEAVVPRAGERYEL